MGPLAEFQAENDRPALRPALHVTRAVDVKTCDREVGAPKAARSWIGAPPEPVFDASVATTRFIYAGRDLYSGGDGSDLING